MSAPRSEDYNAQQMQRYLHSKAISISAAQITRLSRNIVSIDYTGSAVIS